MAQHKELVLLGKQIKAIRLSKELVQDEVAHRADLARSYYSDVERGTRNVSALNLMKIARALGVEVGEIFPKKANL